MPGLGLRPTAWEPTLEALGRPSRTVLLPGYGVRRRRGEEVAPAALGRALVDRLEAADGPVVLLGHSAGAQVAAHAAALAADRVVGLVLVGPSTDPRARSWPALLGRWLRTAGHEPPRQLPVLAWSYARTGPLHGVRTMEAARHDDLQRTLGGVRCPVLVLRGPHDRICPADWAERLVAAAPAGSRTETLPVGAHMVPLTHGPQVAAAVAAYLRPGGSGADVSGA
ncbi:alpha/beta fold hydrolase [Nocardioides marmotae]|uniref:alpha/beta fold hydrolase n=1 Tax=Nocardioides marmotae TaxID=2663857 RepID=UPI0014957576|nr:alpha/beta hydrolase [Nocardioides marmotae]MBC9735571.1 alpha/beta hydrolase [Nocardioides marmotae]QKE02032.1 alpha/beta hydrolase [Nocardioides marmotae]